MSMIDHVIAHELGHYLEDMFSRIRFAWGVTRAFWTDLMPRVAFSEGFANAFSGMPLDEPIYIDTVRLHYRAGLAITMDLEDNSYEEDGRGDGSARHQSRPSFMIFMTLLMMAMTPFP